MLRWIVAALCATEAAYMTVDGVHALTRGDYITPKSGEHAGELGPWARLVSAIGIDPRSSAMKWAFVVYGVAWLVVVVAFALRARWAWWAMAGLAAASLWYLVPGTIISAAALALLLLPVVRSAYLR